MKIGIMVDILNSFELTGLGTYTFKLIESLIREYNRRDVYLINYKKLEKFADLNQIIVPYPLEHISKNYLWTLYASWYFRKNKNILKNIDILHNPYQSPILKLSNSQTAYVITVHDLVQVMFPDKVQRGLYVLQRAFLPKAVRNADKIITVSYSSKRDIITYFDIPDNKVEVTYLAPEEIYQPLKKEEYNTIYKKYNLPEHFILYVGTLEPRKGVKNLIISFYKVKQKVPYLPHKLVIAGKKTNEYKNLLEVAKKLHLEKDIIFMGYIPKADLPKLYNAADLFVFPSFYEGFGLPPLEAMACGTPVIASNRSSVPEIVGDGGIIVDPTDIDKIAEIMLEVLTNESLKKELSKKGLKRAKLFSWEKTTKKTLKIYEKAYNLK